MAVLWFCEFYNIDTRLSLGEVTILGFALGMNPKLKVNFSPAPEAEVFSQTSALYPKPKFSKTLAKFGQLWSELWSNFVL